MLKDFKAFVMKGNVLDLAVAVIIAAAFGAIVTSMVNDIVMPPISMALGHMDFKELFISLNGQPSATLAAAKAAAPVIAYGQFLNTVINFLIPFVIFLAVRAASKLQKPAPAGGPDNERLRVLLHSDSDSRYPVTTLHFPTDGLQGPTSMREYKHSLMSSLRSSGFVLLWCFTGFAVNAWADQVVLKNGDRVTGSIIKKDGKNLTIKTDGFGVVTTSWDQVVSVTADTPVNVVLQNGKTVQGTLATANGKVEVATQDTKLSVTPAEVATIRNAEEQKAYERLLKPGWGELWTGGSNVGLAGTSGNSRNFTFTTGFNAARVTNTDKTSVSFNAIKASALSNGKNSDTAQAVRGGLSYDHNLTPRLFLDTFNDYEYDKFQNLDLRFVVGAGLGFHAVKTERSRLDLLGGVDFNHSSFSTPLIRDSPEAYWGDDYNYKLSAATSLYQSFRMFNDLSNTGTYRMNFDVGASTKLSKWLNWNVSLSDRYLNHPAPGRKTNDFLYTTGLGITFTR
jgi:large conductance mechanosensitive channel protein